MLGTSATRDGLRCAAADASPSCARLSAKLPLCAASANDVTLLLLGTEKSELPSHDESSASNVCDDVTAPEVESDESPLTRSSLTERLLLLLAEDLRNLRGFPLTSLVARDAPLLLLVV